MSIAEVETGRQELTVRQNGASIATIPIVTPEQLELVRRTVAAGATNDELGLYLFDCQRQRVHPLDKLLHFTKRAGKYTPITSIDLMRTRAHETGECAGISDAEFTGDPKQKGFAARVVARRFVQGHIVEFAATARWEEYAPAPGQDHMWQKMPHNMLGKCAEGLALRKAFPQQLSGLYAEEEMDQARELPPVVPAAPSTGDKAADIEAKIKARNGEAVCICTNKPPDKPHFPKCPLWTDPKAAPVVDVTPDPPAEEAKTAPKLNRSDEVRHLVNAPGWGDSTAAHPDRMAQRISEITGVEVTEARFKAMTAEEIQGVRKILESQAKNDAAAAAATKDIFDE